MVIVLSLPMFRPCVILLSVGDILERVSEAQLPRQPTNVPLLCANARPVHNLVKVDVFVPGCPPSADIIHSLLLDLLAGRNPDLHALTHFGA